MSTTKSIEELRKRNVEDNSRVVMMHNFLARAAHDLTIGEQRILFIAFSKIASYKQNDAQHSYRIKITSEELVNLCGISESTASTDLKDAASLLKTRTIKFLPGDLDKGEYWYSNDEPRIRRKNRLYDENGNQFESSEWVWVQNVTKYKASVEILFSELVTKMLTNLEEDKYFTTFKLSELLKLKKQSAIKMFILLVRHAYHGSITIKTEQISYGEKESYRKSFGQLQNGILKPAIQEINQKLNTNIKYEYDLNKRLVTSVTFTGLSGLKHNLIKQEVETAGKSGSKHNSIDKNLTIAFKTTIKAINQLKNTNATAGQKMLIDSLRNNLFTLFDELDKKEQEAFIKSNIEFMEFMKEGNNENI